MPTGDIIDVSLNPSLIAPVIVNGTVDDDDDDDNGIHGNLSGGLHTQLDGTLRTEMTRSRQYSKILLKRKEKPLDRRFLKKSFRYTGYYQQQGDKESHSSESDSEDCKIVNDTATTKPISMVTSSHDNVMGLIQSVESLSNFFDIPAVESSNGLCENQPTSCDSSQKSATSDGSSGYESMERLVLPSTPDVTPNTTPALTGPTGASRIKARKRTKPVPRPRQHRPTAGTMTQQGGDQANNQQELMERQRITTMFSPQLLTTCAAGIGCFGNDGGTISADNSQVTVNIPEDAIPLSAHPYVIQFEVCTDYRPSVHPTHVISPLVHVKSSNTAFTAPITIKIPHHIHNIDTFNYVVLVTKQDLTTQHSVEFTAFPVAKTTETTAKATNDMTCYLKGDHVSISTKSLQDYQWFMLTVTDEAIVRQCRVLVFHSRPKHGNFVVKVTIVEDYTDAIQVSHTYLWLSW